MVSLTNMKTLLLGIAFVIVLYFTIFREINGQHRIINKSIKEDSLVGVIKKQNEYINTMRLDSLTRIIKEQKKQIEVLTDSAKKNITKKTKSKVMKEMIITATFKGQNGSLGYKTGKEYKLRVINTQRNRRVNSPEPVQVEIQDMSNKASNCGYSSMITFLQNWTNVKDVTAEEAKKPKRDPKEYAINFTDFCKKYVGSLPPLKDRLRVKSALDFYNEEFTPEKVLYYFQNWSMTKGNTKYRNCVTLTNNNTELDCKVKIWINDNSEYAFCSGSDGTDNPEMSKAWQYTPKTMSEFISDCLRYEDIELLFRPRTIKKIYG